MSFIGLFKDFQFSGRMLAKDRTFTAIAVMTLAIGIGATVALFSVVSSVLLKPLPYGNSDQLVKIWEKRARIQKGRVSWADYVDWKAQTSTLEAIAAYRTGDFNLTGVGDPEQLQGASVSSGLFPLLRVSPQFGRNFSPDDGKPGAHSAVILSQGLWKRRYGGDPNLLGKPILIDDVPFEVVGIMPSGFFFPDQKTELWEALTIDPRSRMAGRSMHILDVIGRLHPGVTVGQSRTEMSTIAARLALAYPRENTGHGADALLLADDWTSGYRTSLLLIFGAVAFVLLIACANVATLQLSRGVRRRREVAVRSALGGTRGRIVRQLLIESLMLAFMGALASLFLAHWLIQAIIFLTPTDIARIGDSRLDFPVLVFTLLVAVVTGILSGLAPALNMAVPDTSAALKDSAKGTTTSTATNRLRNILVVTEVALSAILLTGAGLLLKSFVLVERVDPGFNTSNVLTANVALQNSNYRPAQRQEFIARVLERLRTDQRVQAAGAVTHLPLTGSGPSFDFRVAGRQPAAPGEESKAQIRCATPDYFRALGIRLLAGRSLSESDSADAPKVVIINDVMARRYWPDKSPLHERISFDQSDGSEVWREIVGVIQGVRHTSLEADPEPQMYTPFSQFSMPFATFVVRTAGEPLAFSKTLRSAVASVDPNEPVSMIRSMRQVSEQSIATRKFSMTLLTSFAGLAMLVASIGIYGVLSYATAQRGAEISIRLALGASVRAVMWLVVKHGMSLAIYGVILGAVGAWSLTRLLSTLLYKVSATDPAVFALISLLLLAVAALASSLPAWRVTKLDPVTALRSE